MSESPTESTALEQEAYNPVDERPAWRRWLPAIAVVVVLVASVVVFATSPRAPSSQAAMGQGLPSTSFGEVVEVRLLPLTVGFVPAGFELVSEDFDGVDRVVQRYRRGLDAGVAVITVTTVVGPFDPASVLDVDEAAESIDVDGVSGVVRRSVDIETGREVTLVRVRVDATHNVIVRGVGDVALEDLVAVAASVEGQS